MTVDAVTGRLVSIPHSSRFQRRASKGHMYVSLSLHEFLVLSPDQNYVHELFLDVRYSPLVPPSPSLAKIHNNQESRATNTKTKHLNTPMNVPHNRRTLGHTEQEKKQQHQKKSNPHNKWSGRWCSAQNDNIAPHTYQQVPPNKQPNY